MDKNTSKSEQVSGYKAIADRLVERGIGRHWNHTPDRGYVIDAQAYRELTAEEFCHDWRVAGACMERMLVDIGNRRIVITDRVQKAFSVGITWYYGSNDGPRINIHDDSLPLAIVLAYLEATDET